VLIAGNWKMFKGPSEAAAFCRALRLAELPDDVDVVVCPPYVSLERAVGMLAGTEIGVFAQSCHWAAEGAFTGEISAPMLRELGVYGTLVGHSERRQYFGETDETAARRARAALEAGLLEPDDGLVIAYEPVWAIGTGKTATPGMVQDAHALIKSLLDAPVLYGGSVKPDNAAELLSQPAVDGALVGGASLDVDAFMTVCRTASRS
jgi:triosephosphate isomerase (TIM)